MDLIRIIESAEKQYKQILEGYFISVYKEEDLPSHGLEHHIRVWNHARELLQSMHGHGLRVTSDLTESLIIASYLHDAGMAEGHGPKHGHLSAVICKDFFDRHSLDESRYPGLYEAIENHDNKQYGNAGELNLQSLLSIADDLDAFGYTGIYRYLEIYTLRGLKPGEIPGKIRHNALSRFSHFERMFSFDLSLIARHRRRYETLDTFFIENRQTSLVIAGIINRSLTGKKNIRSTITGNINNPDPETAMFFTMLNSELS